MAAPKIAVLISAFNNARTLPRAIDSILGQSVSDLELLVIDDGSTDGSAEVARKAIGADSRGRVVAFGANEGIPHALNACLAQAEAPIVAIQDADDWSDPERLGRQLEVLDARPDVALVGVRMREVSPAGEALRERTTYRSGEVNDVLLRFNPIPNGAAAFRRAPVLELGGYDERYSFASEYDLWLRLAERHRVVTIDEVLATREMSESSVAATAERLQLAEALQIRLRALKRRRSLRGAQGLVRPAVSWATPLPVKRALRRARGQAP